MSGTKPALNLNDVPGRQYVALDLHCKACERFLWRYFLWTFEGAENPQPPMAYVTGSRHAGGDPGYIPVVEDGLSLMDCDDCQRPVPVAVAHLRAVLDEMYAPRRHAVERLPV